MCRLLAWRGSNISLDEVLVKPPRSLIEQSQQANEAKLAVNGDGFGFAWYDEAGKLGLYRDVLPAWTDGNLLSLSAMIKSPLFLAHVRASTFGQISRSNCHPFKSGCWSFAHNGQIAHFGQYKRKLEARLSDTLYAERNGNTDSELLFLLLLEYGLDQDVEKAWIEVIRLLDHVTKRSEKPTRIAAVFSDGKQLYAMRYSSDLRSPSLYMNESYKDGVVIASEPLDDCRQAWHPVKESTLVVVRTEEVQSFSLPA